MHCLLCDGKNPFSVVQGTICPPGDLITPVESQWVWENCNCMVGIERMDFCIECVGIWLWDCYSGPEKLKLAVT